MREMVIGEGRRLYAGGGWLLLLGLALVLCACGGSDKDPPVERECTRNEDCGLGYTCQYQRCVCLLCGDTDETEVADSDAEPELDLADGDSGEREEIVEADAEPDAEPDAEAETDSDFQCSPSQPDPSCKTEVKTYCRGNTLNKSVYFCKEGELWHCEQGYDCHAPICGSFTSERKIEPPCETGCVANADPSKNDYCKENPPPDGDLDGETDADPDTEGEAERDSEIVNHDDGAPCSDDSGCLLKSKCVPDMDGISKYCAPATKCVSRSGLTAGQPTLIFNGLDRRCKSAQTWVQCLSTGYWGYATDCTKPKCEDVLFTPGQTCTAQGENYAGCDPIVLPDATYCPGNFRCHTGTSYCWESCTTNTQCRTGYKCKYNPSTPDDPENGTCVSVAGRRK